jgi:hypothetical protein
MMALMAVATMDDREVEKISGGYHVKLRGRLGVELLVCWTFVIDRIERHAVTEETRSRDANVQRRHTIPQYARNA